MEDIIQIPEDILYLVHITKPNYKDASGKLLWNEIRVAGTDQYPGAYFSLITKDNVLTEELYFGSQCLIFSRNLLKQYNYHINLTDNNGFITENNTYFPWNLDDAVAKIKENAALPVSDVGIQYQRMNEVMFHDAVPMEYLCKEIRRPDNIDTFLPDYPIENSVKPNTTLLPFYCFAQPEEENRLTSSSSFFKTFAEFCHIDKSLPKDKIIKKIRAKIPFFRAHRDKQNIEMLNNIYANYTSSLQMRSHKQKIRKYKSKSKSKVSSASKKIKRSPRKNNTRRNQSMNIS